MEQSVGSCSDPKVLTIELLRLQKEIDEANQQKIQAAEYGLAVLQEKQQLQEQLDQLELINEQTSTELQHLKQALTKHEVSSKLEKHISSIEEEQLILDNISKEEEYRTILSRLQSELRLTKQKLEVFQSEEPVQLGFADRLEEAENEKVVLRKDIREFKQRESRILSDYSDLEEENISLQKQVLQLQREQVELDKLKWERDNLLEEIDLYKAQVQEQQHLKSIVENNLEDSIKGLTHEREIRNQLQKEYDELKTQEAIFTLNKMAHLTGISSDIFDMAQSDDEGSPNTSTDATPGGALMGQRGGGGDLFSEIHLSEITKFEELLAEAEKDRAELKEINTKLQQKITETEQKLAGLEEENSSAKIIAEAAKLIRDVDTAELAGETEGDSSFEDNKQQVERLNEVIERYEGRIESLKESAKVKKGVGESLVTLTQSLASIYHLLCQANNETPSRVMLDHAQADGLCTNLTRSASTTDATEMLQMIAQSHLNKDTNSSCSSSHSRASQSADSTLEAEESDPELCSKLVSILTDQTKYLKRSVETAVDRYKQTVADSGHTQDMAELSEQNMKLKAMLSTKREQIATLRSVLKANKSTAEVAMANLKQKSETERLMVTQTMAKTRAEVKALKEDAAAHSTLRALFAQRCDEYVTQLDQLQRQLSSAEEEKKTLNSLLRMAIQQKLGLTQRLEDLEYDKEKRSVKGVGAGSERPRKSYRDERRSSSYHNHTKC
ncbi:protein bicaudal D homolog 2-like isoform X2 [Watersipora subatra]|uniref:protein bicaudal D homolog 2-like isoform X2 n=1 Tax=Watersipora subatra TaxID=2589382 RepID=UPI00355C4F5D